jgi:hypothetical protein
MLAVSHEADLSEEDWRAIASRADLPCGWEQYLADSGKTHTKPNSRRQYPRIGLRTIAIIWHDGDVHAGFTKDVSRIGIGFYSPIQLFPRAAVRLWLPGHDLYELRIRRCRLLKERCFECGATFEADHRKNSAKR